MNEIYAKIRKIRQSKNITLKELSERTGLSLSFLSQVERGKCDITLMSLGRIANTLGIDLKQLFDGPDEAAYYHRREDFKKLDTGHSFLIYEKMSSDFEGKKLDAIRVTCKPHRKTEYEPHEGEELIYVLEGVASVTVNGECYQVRPGECIHYPSTLPHILANEEEEDLVAVIAITQLVY